MTAKLKPYYVEWDDSEAPSTVWLTRAEMEEYHSRPFARCRSVGFIVRETTKQLTLAADLSDYSAGRVIKIPREVVRVKRRLR